jgi:hypothetical protein
MSGTRRSAILMLALDEDSAAEVFKFLSPKEIQLLSMEMAEMEQVSHEEMQQVMLEFSRETEEFIALNLNSSEHIRSVLTKALGSERATSLIEDILENQGSSSGIDSLNLMEASMVAELIRDEHPQIIATILVHLERHQAADVLELSTDKLRNDVVLRIATFSGVQPAALQELTEVLSGMLDGQNLKRSKMGGVRTAAEILNLMNSSWRRPPSRRCAPTARIWPRRSSTRCSCSRTSWIWTTAASSWCSRKSTPTRWWWRSRVLPRRSWRSSCATCRSAPPTSCARTWRPAARFGSPRWRPSRKPSCRSYAAWRIPARSC